MTRTTAATVAILFSLPGCGGEAGLTILALIVAYGILTGLAGEHDRR